MSKEVEKMRFIAIMCENFGASREVTQLAMELMTLARKAERYNVLACNIGLTDSQDKRQD